MTNVITANLSKCRFYRASPVYQYNYGMKLVITGLELPTAYEVDFANDISGTSITQIGGADGVTIPSQFFQPGQAIYCWLRVHPTVDSGVTTATIVIPISPRATITDEEPTPEEQSAIDEAIAALNDAVDRAEDAVEHYPQITNGVWYVWDVDAGEYVSTGIHAQGAQGNPGADGQDGTDGFSPIASVAKVGNTATITITDKTGTTTTQISDGTNGAPGADGFSPTATVTQTASGATISITDKTGTTTANIANGQNGSPGQPGTDGTDGVSPTVTVTDITGGHRITITDATGAHSFDVMDGESGAGAVQDVQVNGTSVVQDGVANVPMAGSNPGVVRVSGYGMKQTNGYLSIDPAASSQIKAGTTGGYAIVPARQHESAFYGLAKAAGDSSQSSSSNAVGQYTDAAKSAIKKMLGVGQWELIKQVTLEEDSASIVINTDELSQNFKLAELAFYISAQASTSTTANTNAYIRIDPNHYVMTISGVVRTSSTTFSGYAKPIIIGESASDLVMAQTNTSIAGSVSFYAGAGALPTSQFESSCKYFEVYTAGTAKFGAGTTVLLFGIKA